MSNYISLKKQVFTFNEYSIVPIRYVDRLDIMKWRNEQIYHLRQNELLTVEKQDWYFDNIVNELFTQEKPNQLLFSYLKDGRCIGYGGLVHINWIDKNAEISFIMDTSLESEEFSKHWKIFLKLAEELAFKELYFHKIFTYAFDLRPRLYDVLTEVGFYEEARLREHCFYQNSYIDVLIHIKINV